MDKTRTTESGARLLRVLSALKGYSLTGLSNKDLATNLKESPATINRCMNTLIEEGFATKLENGRYTLSVKMLQIAVAHANEVQRAHDKINEFQQRVITGAR